MDKKLYEIGMVGLGVMGRNFVLNMADHGHSVAGYDKNPETGQKLVQEGAGKPVAAAANLQEFIGMLRPPRVIILLVAPAKVVDIVIGDLAPLLSPGDLIIDSGNSYFKDTDRRAQFLADKKIHFFGMGISGGEEGARHGPSLMPGGPREGYERMRPVLESVAAKVGNEPCVTWVGPGASGHYVKMVHNGIEYGIMQLISEVYDLMHRGLGLDNDTIGTTFDRWDKGDLNSFLIEITARIFKKKDDEPAAGGLTNNRLIDIVKDVARQKGTGQWTSEEGLNLQVPLPTIDVAVTLRNLSGRIAERQAANKIYGGPAALSVDKTRFLDDLAAALYTAVTTCYAQGLDLLREASKHYSYNLNLADIARIWRGGCIIRAGLLEDLRAAFSAYPELPNVLLDAKLAAKVKAKQGALRSVVKVAVDAGIPVPGLTASLNYFDALRSGTLPLNLIQAQRDFFGAHTFERKDKEGTFHAHWAQ
jgi:6-phosphogluconate dehydrogenase